VIDLDRTNPVDAERQEAGALPYATRFVLGERITGVQQAFLDKNGFILFAKVATPEQVAKILAEAERIQGEWLAEERDQVFGVPIWRGVDHNGERYVQRFAFASCFSDYLHEFVRSDMLAPVRSIIGRSARVGDREKDGVVLNRYINTPGSLRPNLGWHTDGIRSVFYGRMPGPMLNVGLHFNRITADDGGLRVIPGTHTQGFFGMVFGKRYGSHGADADEVAIETEPGDLTVHDGRMWHRVQSSPHTGERSTRWSMYVPYITDAVQLKGEHSKTPLYHRALRWWNERKVRRAQQAIEAKKLLGSSAES
jgi:phytanoyl-CoA hydroxylase